MSWIDILWPMLAAACLVLALINPRIGLGRKLGASEQPFPAMADAVPAMIWMAGTDKLCTSFNRVWLGFTGRTMEQELGNGWTEGVHPEDRDRCFRSYCDAFDSRRDFTMEYRLRRHDGEYRSVLATGVPRLASDGTFLGYNGSCIDITEHQQANEGFRQVVEAAPYGIMKTDSEGRITLVNAQAEKYFGYSRRELIGQFVEMLIPESFRARHLIDRKQFVADPSARNMMNIREVMGRRKDGSEIPLEIGLSPTHSPDGLEVLASIVDISERKRRDELLRQERNFLRQVIDITPNLIFAKDREGRFALANQAVADVYGTTVENLLGKTDADFNPNVAEVEHFQRMDMEVMNSLKERFVPEEFITDARGKGHWLQTVKRPILDKDGTANLVLGSAVDITRRKEVELELAQQRNELAHLSRVAMLGELSGSLAHELNQPLTAILSNAQAALRFLARDPGNIDRIRNILEDIVQDDKRAGEVIRRLRALLKKEEMRFRTIRINDVVLDVSRMMRSDLLNREVALSTELAADLPMVDGDPVQLQQVLLNLIVNGCDAMDGAPADRRLTLRTAASASGEIEVTVADRGRGIPAADLERIFEPFVSTKAEGMGLGLAVCRSIVTAHRGRLWAANNADRGASFHFTLPANREQPNERPGAHRLSG